jgi:murein L,D-transpeptidase YcbB/YkuD
MRCRTLTKVVLLAILAGGSVGLTAPEIRASNLVASTSAGQMGDAQPQTAPLWQSETRFAHLLEALEGLQSHGLNPADYYLHALSRLQNAPAEREQLATKAWLLAAQHLAYGRLHLTEREADWRAGREFVDLQAHLHRAVATGTVASSLDDLAPRNSEYRELMAELDRLRDEPQGQAILLPDGPSLRKGDSGFQVELLKARLAQLGYFVNGMTEAKCGDDLAQAVETFQWDAGLEPDGIVGPATRAILNLSTSRKIDRLRINLERLRWLPGDLGQRHVRVNIAGFEVSAYADSERVQTHRAIVGRLERQTPVFSDHIEYIVFNPWWETPASLARNDELPLFRRDPDAVKRLGFQVLDRDGNVVDPNTIDWNEVPYSPFPYRLRQAPGPLNALGQVKIIFPNRHNVYLHDTPKRQLFSRSKRTFSSGCIRVQGVLDLVRWLLNDPERWGPDQVQAVVASGKERVVRLDEHLPVHILYLTATTTPDGMVRYLPDVYERDEAVLAALETPLPVARAEY